MSKPSFPKSIPEAADMLDVIRPRWYKDIELSVLNMHSFRNCILGQLFGTYNDGLKHFETHGVSSSAGDKIFGDNADRELWVSAIKTRRDIADGREEKPAYPTTIGQAALALDKVLPGWAEKLDMSSLNMASPANCVLGQLFGSYAIGKKKFGKFPYCDSISDIAFGNNANASSWEYERAVRMAGERIRKPAKAEEHDLSAVNLKDLYERFKKEIEDGATVTIKMTNSIHVSKTIVSNTHYAL